MSINVERGFWNSRNTNGWQVVNKKVYLLINYFLYTNLSYTVNKKKASKIYLKFKKYF